MSSCSCCCVPGSSWLCASGGAEDAKCLVKRKQFSSRNTASAALEDPQPGPDLLEEEPAAAGPQENQQNNNNMDIEVLREQYRWTRAQQRTETRVVLFRQVSQELCDAANIIPVAQGLPAPWKPPAASPTLCGTPPLTSDPWHTHLGLHRRACLHVGGGVTLKPASPETGTSFTSSSTCSWPDSSPSDTTSSSQQGASSFSDTTRPSQLGARFRCSSVDSATSRSFISSSDVSAGSSLHSGTGEHICSSSKATEPHDDRSPRGSPGGPRDAAAELHHPTHLSRVPSVDASPEGSLAGSPQQQQQPPSTFPRYASREEEEQEEMDSSVSASRDGSAGGSSPGCSKDASGEGSAGSSDEGSTPTPRSVCNSTSGGMDSHGEQEDHSLDRNVLTAGKLDRDNNNTVAMAAPEALPDNHSQWNGRRSSRKLSAPSLTRQSSLGGYQGATRGALGGYQSPQTPSAPNLHQHYYPFPNRKTPRKSEAARKLGMYSSF